MTESPRAAEAYAEYVALGPDRSLAKLAALRAERRGELGKSSAIVRQLEKWSVEHGWQERLAALVAAQVAAVEAAEAERVRAIMETGYALAHERVDLLKELTGKLVEDLRGERLWLPDRKSIVVGQTAVTNADDTAVIGRVNEYEVLDIERPNSAWLDQVRGLLDDIAQEVGGRVRTTKTELTGKDGDPVAVAVADTTPVAQRLADVAAIFKAASGRTLG